MLTKNKGIIEELLDKLRSKVRIMSGRAESPSLGIIDSRSVKTSHHVDSDRGVDGNKKIKGRKQHIIVDTQGNLMSIAVHEANVHDSKGAPKVIEKLSCKFPRLAKILADGGYRGKLADWILEQFGWEPEADLGLMNVRQNSRFFPNDGLSKEHSPGWETSEAHY